jgi:hypothetical protein
MNPNHVQFSSSFSDGGIFLPLFRSEIEASPALWVPTTQIDFTIGIFALQFHVATNNRNVSEVIDSSLEGPAHPGPPSMEAHDHEDAQYSIGTLTPLPGYQGRHSINCDRYRPETYLSQVYSSMALVIPATASSLSELLVIVLDR